MLCIEQETFNSRTCKGLETIKIKSRQAHHIAWCGFIHIIDPILGPDPMWGCAVAMHGASVIIGVSC